MLYMGIVQNLASSSSSPSIVSFFLPVLFFHVSFYQFASFFVFRPQKR